MKILVDKMPAKVEDCPWSSPIKDPWKDRAFWLCDWSASHSQETCPIANGGECSWFTTMSRQSDLECIIDAFNAVPEVHPVPLADIKKGIKL